MEPKKNKDLEQLNQVEEHIEIPIITFKERTQDLHNHIKAQPGGIKSLYERVKKRIEEENAKMPEDKKIKPIAEKTFYKRLDELITQGSTIYNNINLLIFICEESNYPINSLLTGKVLSSSEREQESYKKGFNDGIAKEKAEQKRNQKAQKPEKINFSDLEKINIIINSYLEIIGKCRYLLYRSPEPNDAYYTLFRDYTKNIPKVFGHGKSIPKLKIIDTIIEFILNNQSLVNHNYELPKNFNHNNIRSLLISAYLYLAIDGFINICRSNKQWKSKGPQWERKTQVNFSINSDSPEQEKELFEHLARIGKNLSWLCKKETLETIAYTIPEATQKYMPSIDSFVNDCNIFSLALRTYEELKKSEFIMLRNSLGLPNVTTYSYTMTIDDNLLTQARNMDNTLVKARKIIKEFEHDCTSFQQMKEETASLLKDIKRIQLKIDDWTYGLVDKIKKAGQELVQEANNMCWVLSNNNIYLQNYRSSNNIDDYSKLTYDYIVHTFKVGDKEYRIKSNENYSLNIRGDDYEFWFDPGLKQAKRNDILIWFDESSQVDHATYNGIEVWLGPGNIKHIRWQDGQEDFYSGRDMLSTHIEPDGSKRNFDYDDSNKLTDVTDQDDNKWKFIYDQDGNFVKILEPDRTAISNPEKALLYREHVGPHKSPLFPEGEELASYYYDEINTITKDKGIEKSINAVDPLQMS